MIMIMILMTFKVHICQLSSGLNVQYDAEDHSADDADHSIDDDDDHDHENYDDDDDYDYDHYDDDDDDEDDDDEDYEKAGVSVAKVSSVLHHP